MASISKFFITTFLVICLFIYETKQINQEISFHNQDTEYHGKILVHSTDTLTKYHIQYDQNTKIPQNCYFCLMEANDSEQGCLIRSNLSESACHYGETSLLKESKNYKLSLFDSEENEIVFRSFTTKVQIVRTNIPEVFHSSVTYENSATEGEDLSGFCVIRDTASDSELICDGPGNRCPCLGGRIVSLEPDTLYNITMTQLSTGQVLGIIHFRTASLGTLETDSGPFHVQYTIKYSAGAIIPTTCNARVSNFNNQPISSVKLTQQECLSGKFDVEDDDRSYNVVITAGGDIFYSLQIRTKRGSIDQTFKSLFSVDFQILSDYEFGFFDECTITDLLTSISYKCIGNTVCYCEADNIEGLQPTTFYHFEIKTMDGVIVARGRMNTAGFGTVNIQQLSAIKVVATVNYTDNDFIPSVCFPCLLDIDKDGSLQRCINSATFGRMSRTFCSTYSREDIESNGEYNFYLLDSDKNMVANSTNIRALRANVLFSSFELTSISYILDTEFPFNRSQPCQFTDDFENAYNCRIFNRNTTDCNCLSGTLVGLRQDAFIHVSVYQNNTLIARNQQLYTAYRGALAGHITGLSITAYEFNYGTFRFAPDQCQVCAIKLDGVDPATSCQNHLPEFGRTWCRGGRITGLESNSTYALVMFDGDGVLMQNITFYTTGPPENYTFLREEDGINYQLSYSDISKRLKQCNTFFEQNPGVPVLCAPNTRCTCISGKISLPEGFEHSTLVITDFFGHLIAREATGDPSQPSSGDFTVVQASVGYIIGLIIAILAIITILVVFLALSMKAKRSYNFLKEPQSLTEQ